jgi:hypothetical protein
MIQTELSADTRVVADLLIAAPVGELVALAAVSALIGRDILTCRHVLQNARRVAQREAGAVFTAERGVGLRRMSAERAIEVIGPNARKHVRRTAAKARRALIAATDGANQLSDDAMRRRAAEISALGLMEHIARDVTVKPAADAPTKPTPVAITARQLFAVISGKKEDAA